MRNRKQTEDAGGVLCALSCMKIILPRDILQMHLHISLQDSLIGVTPVRFPVGNLFRPNHHIYTKTNSLLTSLYVQIPTLHQYLKSKSNFKNRVELI